ncbi:MAG: M14 family zinc carboxypeptidase [Blastocatellia bacterium]
MQTLRFTLPALLLAIVLLTATPRFRAQQTTDESIVARVTIQKNQDLHRFVALGLDLLETREGDDLFILTNRQEIERLRSDGWRVSVDESLTQPTLRSAALALQTFQGGYRTVAEMRAQLEAGAARNPDIAEFFVHGQSWEKMNTAGAGGHDLFGIKLTNRLKSGSKPTFFLMAAIHARELATAEVAMRFADHLLNNYGADADVTWLLDEQQVIIVPVVNPDGRILAEQGYLQRKNTNNTYGGTCATPPNGGSQFGVDLNRNYTFQWGLVNKPTENPCGLTYPGPVEASEPETKAIQDLVRSHFPDQRGPNDADAAPSDATGIMLTLHSFGDLVLWPWGVTSVKAPNAAELELIGRRLAAYNGYTPQQAIHLYPTSGTTDDWSYGELGVASFTFEIGPSSGPCGGFFAPYSCLDGGSGGSFWQRNLPALLYAARIARAPYALAHGPTPESLTAAPTGDGRVELRASFDESRNGNQKIVAAEVYVETPPWRGGAAIQMNAADGSFDSVNETATITINASAIRSLFYVRAKDADGNWGPVRAAYASRQIASEKPRARISRSAAGRAISR